MPHMELKCQNAAYTIWAPHRVYICGKSILRCKKASPYNAIVNRKTVEKKERGKKTMKRILSVILALVTICCCLIAVPAAMAETASGTNAKKETFTIHSDSSGAFFVLSSSTGLANVAQHNWYGRRTGEGDEKTHGFYDVHVKGPGLDKWMKWAPSATTRKSEVTTCREVRISLPYRGDYTVDVYPMATYQASDYWRVDFIRYWVYNASWHVTILSKCKLKK